MKPNSKLQRFMLAFIIAGCWFAFAMWIAEQARAADVVTVTPDATTSEAQSPNGYTITLSGDTNATKIKLLLPSHGRPCGYPDEPGDPAIGGDSTTNYVVTDAAGGILNGRWLSWVGDYPPGTSFHVSVLTPPLGGCFYSGATATADTKVTGLKRGASVFNDQSSILATGGSTHAADASSRAVTVTWWMRNGTNQDATITTERLGASDGFTLDSSTFTDPPARLSKGVIWVWHDTLTIPAHSQILEQAYLERPCGSGSVNLRLRIVRSDGLAAGTGNGVSLDLAAC